MRRNSIVRVLFLFGAAALACVSALASPANARRHHAAPVNTAPPTISGLPVQGKTLTATRGSWRNTSSSYTYQWRDCASSGCRAIPGATSSLHTLQASDVRYTIDVVVTARNSWGSTSATSAATAVVTMASGTSRPTNIAVPTISGTAQQGQTLTASNGSWSGSPTSYAYQWRDCNGSGSSCTNIASATGSSYLLTSSDVGNTIDVMVTAANAGGYASATSATTGAVATSSGGVPAGGRGGLFCGSGCMRLPRPELPQRRCELPLFIAVLLGSDHRLDAGADDPEPQR